MHDRFIFRYVFQKKLDNGQTITSLKHFDIEDIEHPNFMDEINELTRKGYVLITRNLSTGLKDKNGKLIFEGDIVKKKGNKFFSTIVFNHDSSALMYSDEQGIHFFYHRTAEKLEVLGNIYKNPELLKELQE